MQLEKDHFSVGFLFHFSRVLQCVWSFRKKFAYIPLFVSLVLISMGKILFVSSFLGIRGQLENFYFMGKFRKILWFGHTLFCNEIFCVKFSF